MTIKLRSEFIYGDPDSILKMGGYRFPILDEAINLGIGTGYKVVTARIASNNLQDLFDLIDSSSVLSYVKGGNLVAIDGDFTFSDMGLYLRSDDLAFNRALVKQSVRTVASVHGNYGAFELTTRAENSLHPTRMAPRQLPSEKVVDLFTQGSDKSGAKLEKRAGTIGRPFRASVTAPMIDQKRFRVLLLPESPTLDGWGVVNGRLLKEAIDNLQFVDWIPELRASAMRWWDRQLVMNTRAIGLEDAVTGEWLEGHLKLQCAVDYDMDPDIDFITSLDSLKKEMGVRPDGEISVAGFEPQSMKDAFEDQQTVTNHPFLLSIPEVRSRIKSEATKALEKLMNGTMMTSAEELADAEFHRRFPWEGEAFNRMLRWKTSAYVLYGREYLDSVWLTNQLGMQWTQTLNWNSANWLKTLKVIIPCAVRAQVISQSAANLLSDINMEVERGKPRWNTKLKCLVINDEDWVNVIIPSHGGCDLDDFFVVRWITFQGKKYILLTRNPNNRGEYSLWEYTEGDWHPSYINAKGEEVTFPEITRKQWPKQILKALEDGDTVYLDLPSDVDPNATLDDDRMFVLQEQQAIRERIIASGKGVDSILVRRLGADDIPSDLNGPITKAKNVMRDNIQDYIAKMLKFKKSLLIPEWLVELGGADKRLYKSMEQALVRSRTAQFHANIAMTHATDEERSTAVKQAQEDALMPIFLDEEDRALRAQKAMALWYACRIKETGSTKQITDQVMFGTDIFDFLIDALLFFGIAQKPGYLYVEYKGDFKWDVRCRVGGEVYENLTLVQLIRYWANERTCKQHLQA